MKTTAFFATNSSIPQILAASLLAVTIPACIDEDGSQQRGEPLPSAEISSPLTICLNGNQPRREFRTLSDTERQHFLDVLSQLTLRPAPDQPSFIDSLAKQHGRQVYLTHGYAVSLPWHRYFLVQLETELQKRDPTLTLPYWDTSLDSQQPEFALVWSSANFGGNGDADTLCVSNGTFRNFRPLFANEHCLKRDWYSDLEHGISSFAAPEIINQIVFGADNYSAFRRDIERQAYGRILNTIRGDMASIRSPNDPLYFLIAANLDRLWDSWQSVRPQNKTDYLGSNFDGTSASLFDYLPGFINVRVQNVLDTNALCYHY